MGIVVYLDILVNPVIQEFQDSLVFQDGPVGPGLAVILVYLAIPVGQGFQVKAVSLVIQVGPGGQEYLDTVV